MKGIIKSVRGEISYSVNEKQVVVLKGKGLKYEGKKYNFIIRIDPPEEGLKTPVLIIDLVTYFDASAEWKEELCKFAEKTWYDYLDKYPSVKMRFNREIKVSTNKHKLEQLRAAVAKCRASLEAAEAILKELSL